MLVCCYPWLMEGVKGLRKDMRKEPNPITHKVSGGERKTKGEAG